MDTVDIKMTKDEALVLFELLSRYSDSDLLSINDNAEQQALWSLNNRLEKILSEPFSQDWKSTLEAAKSRLCGES